jgi:PAB-dependent poly(A)-specific ribonuclease subunit 3
MSSNWSETGDRYLLKLFRDYVFHQVYEDGNPYIDFAHVIDCLNKVHFLVSFRISVDD